MLLIGDRVVLRANAPPEAEYFLFEIADIELRSSEHGRVREHGYQTTVARARARLAHSGITPSLAHDCAAAMQPTLSSAYARGTAAKHVARYLGPLELFQADHYDGNVHAYRGVFVDLPALVRDLDLPGAAVALQAMYLSMLLEGEADETTVFLSTDAWTKLRKPGERTHRRPSSAAVKSIKSALGELASAAPHPVISEQLPRADVIAFVRSRAELAPDQDARDLYASLERSIAVRDMPDKGPLADPELWSIEIRLDTADFDGILDAVEAVERSRGRTPGTTYLRARASLALRLEPPKLIAERVSALALSMTSFGELSLLAAESWLEAGDPRRAMPYARDLVDAPGVDEGLLLRAKRLLARAVGAAPDTHATQVDSIPAAPMPASQAPGAVRRPSMPPVSVPDPHAPSRSWSKEKSRTPTDREELRPRTVRGIGEADHPSTPPGGAPADDLELDLGSAMRAPPPSALPPPARVPAPRPPSLAPPAQPELDAPKVSSKPPAFASSPERASAPPASWGSKPLPVPSVPPLRRQRPQAADVEPNASAPPLELELPPPVAASFTLELPSPEPEPPPPPPSARGSSETSDAGASSRRPPVRRQSMGVVRVESRAPPGFDPRAEPDGDEPPARAPSRAPSRRPSRESGSAKPTLREDEPDQAQLLAATPSVPPVPRTPREAFDPSARPTPMLPPASSPRPARSSAAAPAGHGTRPSMPTPILDADLGPDSTDERARALQRERDIRLASSRPAPVETALHGASLPPYRLENPPPLLPKAPLFPKLGGAGDELAEHLPLPPGVGADARLDALPQSVLEARVAFTLLARELGLDYRLRRGLELHSDVSAIEAMQSVLLESFPDHGIRTAEDAAELRRHGALLSEILARRLDAEWIDISPNELGYWAMIVPPDTRVWPFGRVARLVEMGHKERDLVSYFFELQGRARGR